MSIDPETLGKVFENLIEENRRKGLGVYYTPREIVHYICQESLINYLDNQRYADASPVWMRDQKSRARAAIPRADIETFIHLGKQISHSKAREVKYAIKMPKSIKQYARLIDEKLADIAVCDPAVGAGSLLIGMMTEIVRARCALAPCLKSGVDISAACHFKRHAIQNCLYGVDIDSSAIEIAKRCLGLSLIANEEKVKQIKVPQNLDFKVIVGNSLVNDENDPFKRVCFSKIFRQKGGFDIIIANPPYVNARSMAKYNPELRKLIKSSYSMTKGSWDIYIAFFERGFSLLNQRGTLAFITPDKWISKPFGDELRIQTTDKICSMLKIGRGAFESANIDAIISIYANMPQPLLRVYEYTGTEIRLKSVVQKSALKSPYTYDGLFSRHSELLAKIESHSGRLSELGLCENSCATDDAYRLRALIQEEPVHAKRDQYLRMINTGTIGKYISKWGIRKMTYLGKTYFRPVVNKKQFLATFSKSYSIKSVRKKLIVKGLNLLDACLDAEGHIIPGIPTLLIASDNLETLKIILAIVNSATAFFYIKEKYSASSYNQGITFTKEMINNLPIPKITLTDRAQLVSVIDRILAAKQRESERLSVKHEIDELVYVLYGLTEKEKAIVKSADARQKSEYRSQNTEVRS